MDKEGGAPGPKQPISSPWDVTLGTAGESCHSDTHTHTRTRFTFAIRRSQSLLHLLLLRLLLFVAPLHAPIRSIRSDREVGPAPRSQRSAWPLSGLRTVVQGTELKVNQRLESIRREPHNVNWAVVWSAEGVSAARGCQRRSVSVEDKRKSLSLKPFAMCIKRN